LRPYLEVFALAYLNDILVYSIDEKEYSGYIRKVLEVLAKYNLRAKLSKCEFYTYEITFLGYILILGYIGIDLAKVQLVL